MSDTLNTKDTNSYEVEVTQKYSASIIYVTDIDIAPNCDESWDQFYYSSGPIIGSCAIPTFEKK
jgi:hypothetical protein